MQTSLINALARGLAVLCVLLGAGPNFAQGTFLNLYFESPIPPLVPDFQFRVSVSNALPGWIGYLGGSEVDWVLYNSVSIGSAAISLQGPGSLNPPIQGNYSVILQPSSGGLATDAAVGQTGQIPVDAQSLLFYGASSLQVTFAGQPLALVTLQTAQQYSLLGADISALAGQAGELRFTQPNLPFPSMVYLDNIVFSAEPILEPSVPSLLALAVLLMSRRMLCSEP